MHWSKSKNELELADNLWSTFTDLKSQNADRLALQESNQKAFDNYLADLPGQSTEVRRALRLIKEPVAMNCISSVIETITSKLAGNKPGVRLLSSDADYALRSEIKKLNNFLTSDWERMKLYSEVRQVVKDALIYNTGFLKFFSENNRVQCERVNPLSIYIDDQDGLYGKPQQFIQTRHVSKEKLKDLFPKHKSAIEKADPLTSITGDTATVLDLVTVVEAWMLPTKKGKADGRHVIMIEGTVLLDNKEYDNIAGPFVSYRFIKRQVGFWGQAITEMLKGIQSEINKVILNIQRSVHLASKPYMLISAGAGIKPEIIDNNRNRLSLVYYNQGSPKPELVNPSAVNGELLRYLDYLWNRAFEISGVSQSHATARKEPGITSGVAIREVADIQSQRFLAAEQDLHQFFVDCAHQTLHHAAAIAENEDYDVSVITNDVYQTIKWSEINLATDQYLIRPLPVSQLSKTYAGRVQQVSELMEGQLIDPEIAQELLELPDLDRHRNLKNSGRNLVRKIIEKIIDDAVYTPPDHMMDLDFAMLHGTQVYNLSRIEEMVPEENLELLAQWLSEVEMLLQQMAPPPEQPMPEGEMQ